ncbi:MAG: polysaccharide biosynthesis tyrosine autokinase [Synechococcales cyanobacterium T60_A2020_003]|nr:polysaccharide biosynthesis tyrosine autokinase [Synechococcales cyanobacterium T60_A2020_003]
MLAESNRPSVSVQQPAAQPSLSADALYRANATATDRVFQIFQRRKWAIATAALAAASGVWAWTLTRPYIYEGQVRLSPDSTESVDDASRELEPNLPAVLNATAESLNPDYPDVTYQTLSENLVMTSQDSRNVSVRYQGGSPSEVEAVLTEIAQQYQEASSNPVIVSPPTVGDRPISPKILRGLLLGAIAGLSMGAAAALLTEKLDRSFHSPDSLKTFTKLPMLGIIPFFKTLQPAKPGRISPPVNPTISGMGDYEMASFLEAFRTLYSNLRFLKSDRSVRSLVISSAIPAEGKSTTAVNLAKAAAVMGQRVLLVDADLRLPQIHARLQLPNSAGLSEILGQQIPWQDCLQSALDENLQVLPAGSIPTDPVRLLSSVAMRDLMHELSDAFDLVIYDMPPLLGFTDSGLVAAHTDGMVMVVGLGTTTRVELKQALDSLEVMPVQVLGIVANGIRSHTTKAYSYDRYHRYYAQRAMVSAASAPAIDSELISATVLDGELEAQGAIASEPDLQPSIEPEGLVSADTQIQPLDAETTGNDRMAIAPALDQAEDEAGSVDRDAEPTESFYPEAELLEDVANLLEPEEMQGSDDAIASTMNTEAVEQDLDSVSALTDTDGLDTEPDVSTEIPESILTDAGLNIEAAPETSATASDIHALESNILELDTSQLEEVHLELDAELDEDLDADLDSSTVVPLDLDALTESDAIATDSTVAPDALNEEGIIDDVVEPLEPELDEDLEDLTDEAIALPSLTDADLDAADLSMDEVAVADLSDNTLHTFGQNGFDNSVAVDEIEAADNHESISSAPSNENNGTDADHEVEQTDQPTHDFPASSLSDHWSTLIYEESADAFADEEPPTPFSFLEEFLAAAADTDLQSEPDPGSGAIAEESNLSFTPDKAETMVKAEALGTELSAEELAHLEAQGLLESLALPNDSILEEDAEFTARVDQPEDEPSEDASTSILSRDVEEREPLTDDRAEPLGVEAISSTSGEDSDIAEEMQDGDFSEPSDMSTLILSNETEHVLEALTDGSESEELESEALPDAVGDSEEQGFVDPSDVSTLILSSDTESITDTSESKPLDAIVHPEEKSMVESIDTETLTESANTLEMESTVEPADFGTIHQEVENPTDLQREAETLDEHPLTDLESLSDGLAVDQNGRSPDLDFNSGAIAQDDEFTHALSADNLHDLLDDEDWDSEDDGLHDDVTELEEQELEELLAWDSVTLSQYVSSQFERAVLSAQDAIRLGETAETSDDWLNLSTHWQQAAELMGLVPESDPNFDIAQRCKVLYQSNSEYAYQKARHDAELHE